MVKEASRLRQFRRHREGCRKQLVLVVDKILMEVHHNLVVVLIKLVVVPQEIKVVNMVQVVLVDRVEVL